MKKRHKAFIFHSFMWKSVSDCVCAEPNFQKSLNRHVQVCRHNFPGGLGEARAFIPVAQGCSGQRQAGGASDERLRSTPRGSMERCGPVHGAGGWRQALSEPRG